MTTFLRIPPRSATPGCPRCLRNLVCDPCFAERVADLNPGWRFLGGAAGPAATELSTRSEYLGRFETPDSISLGAWAPAWVVALWRAAEGAQSQRASFRTLLRLVEPRVEIHPELALLADFDANRLSIRTYLASVGAMP